MTRRYLFVTLLLIIIASFTWAQSNEDCEACHSDRDLTAQRGGRTVSMFVNFGQFSRSVHKDAECVDCHQDAAVDDFPHPEGLEKVNCGMCHDVADEEFQSGIHGRALKRGAPYAPTCSECHGTHSILPPSNVNSRTYKMNIPVLCGKCHREGAAVARIYNIPEHDILSNYSQSIHGEGLFKQGLIVTATCNDCHGNHLVLPHTNSRSTVSVRNIAATCTVCHARIEEVHTKIISGEMWEQEPGSIPACSDCHRPHMIQRDSIVQRTSDRECLVCHEKADVHKIVDGETVSLTVKKEDFEESTHRNIPCVKCHTDINPKKQRPCEPVSRVDCSSCHAQMAEEYFQSDHGEAFVENKKNVPYCTDCHGSHKVLAHTDERDKTFRSNIPQLCGECHGKLGTPAPAETEAGVLIDYSSSVHGQGLIKKGLLPTAVCTDCHGAHYILDHENELSSIHYKNLPATCASCHKGIYDEYAKSIHSITKESKEKLPTCEDCHSAHRISNIGQDKFMTEITHQCGSCHEDLSETYLETIHGKAYTLGYLKSARCSDCHGAHEIQKVDDPESMVGFNKVVDTCEKCHADVNLRFTGYLTHATHHDKQKYPILYFTFWAMTFLLIGVFSFFGIHTLLWFPRSFKHLKKKREDEKLHKHKKYYIQRFTREQRITHVFVIFSFMILAVTGMMLKFANMPWAQALSEILGGVENAGFIHRVGAVITFGYFFAHVFSLVRIRKSTKTTWWKMITGKRSLWFRKKDLQDFIGSIKWFLGKGPRPDYGRFTYWEKFDYLAVFWGVGIIGFSGLVLWFPELFTKLFPGWFINVAMIIHSDEALLAVGFIFTVHFFNTHLRPESFPLDPVIFTGLVPLDEYKADRPEEYEYLIESGRIKKDVVLKEISPKRMLTIKIFGYSLLFIGLSLVVLIIYSMLFGYK
ncbi:cytochrome c3 family protein [Acidobacteriota bacterium]